MAFLKSVVKKRTRRPPELQDLANYLCGSMDGAFANESTDISHKWTRLQSVTRRLRNKINLSCVSDDDNMTLYLNVFVLRRGVAEFALLNSIREYYRRKLLAKPKQGKLYEVTIATSCGVATSHASRTGASFIELD